MRPYNFKTSAVHMIVAATCLLWPLRAAAQFGFGNPESQPPAIQPQSAPLTHRFALYRDYRESHLTATNDIAVPQELQQTPVFENAPFLRLKPGDKLCTGIEHRRSKAFRRDTTYYFVLRDGKYYELDRVAKNAKLRLWDVSLSLLFDWDVSLETAGQLRQIYGPSDALPIALKSYGALKLAVQQKFPNIECEVGQITVQQPFLEGDGGMRHAVFEGVAFDQNTDSIYQYKLQIGPQMIREERQSLIAGPPIIQRWEFEGMEPINGPNGNSGYHPDAQTAAVKRAAYERMVAFQHILEPFVPGLKNRGDAPGFEF